MPLRKFVAIVAVLSLVLPTLALANVGAQQRQMDSAEIRQMQARLQTLGLYEGPIDGIYGPQTAHALAAYQRAHGLAVTGTVTEETRQALLGPRERMSSTAMAPTAPEPTAEEIAGTAESALASGAVGAAAGATLGAIAGSAAVGAAIGGPIGLAAGALGAALYGPITNLFSGNGANQ